MITELQHRRTTTSTTKSSRRSSLNKTTTTNGQRAAIRRRKRASEPSSTSRAAFFIRTLIFALATIPLVLIARHLRNGNINADEASSNNHISNSLTSIQRNPKLKHAAINPANIPSLDELEAEERANQREARYQSLYRPKFDESSLGYDIYNCPLTPTTDYPKSWKSVDVLSDWNPNDVITKSQRDIYQGLCVFDYQAQYTTALNYRNLEKPFIIRNDPRVTAVGRRWGDDPEYLHGVLGDAKEYRTERSPSNQFMYYRVRGKRHPKGYMPPPNDEIEMTFGEWLEHAMEKDGVALGDEDLIAKSQALKDRRMQLKQQSDQEDHDPLEDDEKELKDEDSEESKEEKYYYFRINADLRSEKKESKFIYSELPFFDPRKKKDSQFYIVDPLQQRGINCRFGMRGITAANHFDMSRNTIAIFGGERRYVLAAPSQCKKMALYPMKHPSLRHSSFDWSNPDEWEDHPEFKEALINEVVLHEGDVLYLPTNWFHFIVNLSLNYQCNARSGTTFESSTEIGDCGFHMPT